MAIKQAVDNAISSLGNALPGFGMTSDQAKIRANADKKAQCEAQGGTWDGTKCIFNSTLIGKSKTTPKNTDEPKNVPSQDQVFRDQKTGDISGVTINGKTFLGVNAAQVEDIIAADQARKKGGQATRTFEQEALAKQQATQQQNDLATAQGQAKTQPTITEADILKAVPQEDLLNKGQAIGAGIIGAGAGGFAGAGIGAKTGALLGSAIAPGVGTAIGAIGGALIGGIGAAYTKIALDKRKDVSQAVKVAQIANTNFGQTIDALNAGLISHEEALRRWNEDKVSLYAAYANLKRETANDLDRFLSGGADELALTEDYIRDLQDIYTTEFLLAYSNPNPKNIKYLNLNTEE